MAGSIPSDPAQKAEFVQLAATGAVPVLTLCHRFGISRATGYRWLADWTEHGSASLVARSRRPHRSPQQTPAAIEALVVEVRQAHPSWGGEKIAAVLRQRQVEGVPSGRTCTTILGRHGLLDPQSSRVPIQRFEAEQPNDLWQLDFKGPLTQRQGKLWALSVLDDHSRYLVGLVACPRQTEETVRDAMTTLFRAAGLPWRILTDNGSPWGNPNQQHTLTTFSFWLIRLGIAVSHGRPFHPQTQGKVERFHRTLQTDLLATTPLPDPASAETAFARFRTTYNTERPHHALDNQVPADRYQPSPRDFPEVLPPIVYPDDARVVTVKPGGQIELHRNQFVFVTQALARQPIALRPTIHDGVWQVQYCHHVLGLLDETGADRPRFHRGVIDPLALE